MASKVKRKDSFYFVGFIAGGTTLKELIGCTKAMYSTYYFTENLYFAPHKTWSRPITKKVKITVEEL